MLCPACLKFDIETEGVSQVNGTLYCALHAVESLAFLGYAQSGIQGPKRNLLPPHFTKPYEPPPVPEGAVPMEPTP